MATTIGGGLHGLDTKDICEYTRKSRKYDYEITASDGGTVRLKIEVYTPPVLDWDPEPGKWVTLVKRFKTESGQTTSGTFTIPGKSGESRLIKFIFSRGIGTKGVDYTFTMSPA